MKRRVIIGSVIGGAASAGLGYAWLEGSTDSKSRCYDSCRFDELLVINKKEESVDAMVTIERNGENIMNRTVTLPPRKPSKDSVTNIELPEERTGTFVVTVETDQDKVTNNITENTGSEEYMMIAEITERGNLIAYGSQ